MEVRRYSGTDLVACLAIFESNFSGTTAQSKRQDFEEFLRKNEFPYFVMDHDGTVVGSGGYILGPKAGEAELVWGMIREDSRKLGLGRFLLLFRLREIGKHENVSIVRAEAPAQFSGFFEKQGFKVGGTVPGGFGPGLDGIVLIKRLAVCS